MSFIHRISALRRFMIPLNISVLDTYRSSGLVMNADVTSFSSLTASNYLRRRSKTIWLFPLLSRSNCTGLKTFLPEAIRQPQANLS
jgi:hypothetical protein